MPFHALGSEHDATTMMTSRTKRVGMSTLLTFSMPRLTPRTTTRWVMVMKATVHTMGSMGDDVNLLKYSCT